jgi:hypothetical protein
MFVHLKELEAKRPGGTKGNRTPSLVTNEKCKTQASTPQMAIATLPRTQNNAKCFAIPFSIERCSKPMKQKLSFQNCRMHFLFERPSVYMTRDMCLFTSLVLFFAHHVQDKSQHAQALTACAILTVTCSLELGQWRPGRNKNSSVETAHCCSQSTSASSETQRTPYNVSQHTSGNDNSRPEYLKMQLQTCMSDTQVLRNSQSQIDSSVEAARNFGLSYLIDANSQKQHFLRSEQRKRA